MYNSELVNSAMGARRLTNPEVARIAGVAPKTVSAIRNGKDSVTLPTLKKVADALDLQLIVRFEKKEVAHA
jgi:transcriptional regulator with XRE-family HTH domain